MVSHQQLWACWAALQRQRGRVQPGTLEVDQLGSAVLLPGLWSLSSLSFSLSAAVESTPPPTSCRFSLGGVLFSHSPFGKKQPSCNGEILLGSPKSCGLRILWIPNHSGEPGPVKLFNYLPSMPGTFHRADTNFVPSGLFS